MNNLYFQLDGDKSAFVRLVSKISRIMKLTLFLVCLSISMSFAMTTNAQSTSLSFKATDQSIKEVLELIESQTDFHFFYNSKLVDINQVISVDIKDKDVFTTLDHIFKNSNIRYKIVGKDVILSVKGSKSDQDEKTVTGTVVDEAGEPIIGANIVEKGKANGTMSDLNGHFSIVVSSDAVLQISYIGFSLHEEAVKNKNVLQVIMKEDTQKLDEVVVVGYGSVDKKELTSAVTAVSSKDFLQGAFTSPLSMIDGKVSGVNVSNAAAADPNSSPNIQMRGASSIEAGNSPLVIIDGMPGADLRSVANQDIESITILKDGSAAAIYGSRAANGVILVQTKKGKAGKVSISYDGYIDHDMVANQPKVLSVDEFLAHERDVDFGHRVDWYDKLLNKSNLGQSHYLAVSGGSENLTFRASANYKKKVLPVHQRYTEYLPGKWSGSLLQWKYPQYTRLCHCCKGRHIRRLHIPSRKIPQDPFGQSLFSPRNCREHNRSLRQAGTARNLLPHCCLRPFLPQTELPFDPDPEPPAYWYHRRRFFLLPDNRPWK